MDENFSRSEILIIESCIRKVFCELLSGESSMEDLVAISDNIKYGAFGHFPGERLEENFAENFNEDTLSLLLKTKEIYNKLSKKSKLIEECGACGCAPCDCNWGDVC